MIRIPLILSLLALLPASAIAQTTWYVPGDSSTIQGAIFLATTGDYILVSPGTYTENLDLLGKGLIIKSTDGAATTTINGMANETLVLLNNTPSGTEVEGFLLTGGSGHPSPSSFGYDYYGGAVHASNGAKATIRNCFLIRNAIGTGTFAGGAYSGGSGTHLELEYCVIAYNEAWASGGATLADGYGKISLRKCTVFGNTSTNFFGYQGGVAGANDGDTWIDDSIIWGNEGDDIGAFGAPYNVGVDFYVNYSDVDGGWAGTGNIDADPLFAGSLSSDFYLRPLSPCINTGDPNSPSETDGSPADMGAFPFEGPGLHTSPLVAGEIAHITVNNATPSEKVWIGYSLVGGGPYSSSWGAILLSPPFSFLSPRLANSAGQLRIHRNVLSTLPIGQMVWMQAFDAGSLSLSNGISLTVQ